MDLRAYRNRVICAYYVEETKCTTRRTGSARSSIFFPIKVEFQTQLVRWFGCWFFFGGVVVVCLVVVLYLGFFLFAGFGFLL